MDASSGTAAPAALTDDELMALAQDFLGPLCRDWQADLATQGKAFDPDLAGRPPAADPVERARRADLVVLSDAIPGTNCGNCEYVDAARGYCTHPKVDQPVEAHWCCSFWDRQGTRRVADEMADAGKEGKAFTPAPFRGQGGEVAPEASEWKADRQGDPDDIPEATGGGAGLRAEPANPEGGLP